MTDALALLCRIEADLAKLRSLLDAPVPAEPAAEEWLAPCEIAGRLGIGEPHVRKLVKRGIARDLSGFAKRGGRLFATVDAVRSIRAG